jgi:hypothetical protein
MPSKNLANSYLSLQAYDGTATVSATMKIGTGNITWTEARVLNYTPNRGKIRPQDGATVQEGEDTPMAVNFDVVFEEYVATGTTYSPPELLHSGFRAAADDTCGPSSVNIVLDTTDDCGVGAERLIFPRFRWENLSYDIEQGQITCQGNCLAIEPIRTTIS